MSKHSSAFKILQDQLKWVDLVFEVRDARVPISSGHPNSLGIFGAKPRLIILAKDDLSDQLRNKILLEDKDQFIALNLKTSKGKDKLFKLALELTKEKRARDKAKGLLPRPMRACVVGMPNVGKSTFINWIIGQKRAKTGNAPGITKGAQWVRIHPQIELMDTPGFLPSTDYDNEAKFKLALLNLLPEAHYEPVEIAEQGLCLIAEKYRHHLQCYFKDTLNSQELSLAKIALVRNYLQTGAVPDISRAAMIFLSELRAGKLGAITLD